MIRARLGRFLPFLRPKPPHPGGDTADRVPARWLRRPRIAPGDRLCLFVMVARDGRLLPHSVDHAAAWHASGYKVVLIVAVDVFDTPIDLAPVAFAHAVVLRINRGYDFGAWAAAIRRLRRKLHRCAVVALANDSVLGPSARFDAMVRRAEASPAELIGLVASNEVQPHFQSFVLFFKPGAIGAEVFRRFWHDVRSGDRRYVIDHYELQLLARFSEAGVRAEAMFLPGEPQDGNPTLTRWRELLDACFPYIKVQLLRDNPFDSSLTDWRAAARHSGFDLAMVDRQVAALGITVRELVDTSDLQEADHGAA